jgi:tetratricopeptide (TPR) repeat protein
MNSPSISHGLEAYFTDVEPLRALFDKLLAVPALPRRLLVIHGVGGVGKSSLLRMFQLQARSAHVPCGLASGDEAKAAPDILSGWAKDLKRENARLPVFSQTLANYHALQAKVEDQARKAQETRGKAAQTFGKAAAKTAIEIAAGYIPVVGPIVSALGSTSLEALSDWLGSFLSRPEIDLLLDPAQKLTRDFLGDLKHTAAKQRVVLILDAFEQLVSVEEWTRDLAQQLPPNVLLVLAGRGAPNWERAWPGWLAQAQVEELTPMTKRVMHELIRRYYATQRGGEPDARQVEAIIQFARGLPIVVTSAVQLWVQYGVEDFRAVKPQIVADLVDRLLEDVPPAIRPALEAAAIFRWFNKDLLRAALEQPGIEAVYNELRHFPFVRPRAEGLTLHDTIRDILDENVRVHEPARHRQLHERAAAYLDQLAANAPGTEGERFKLERLYHLVCADEQSGLAIFQPVAEEISNYRLFNQLRTLLADASTYPWERPNSRLWLRYFATRLIYDHVEAEKAYRAISEAEAAEPKLRAYALSGLGTILKRTKWLAVEGGLARLRQIAEQSDRLLPETDPKRLANLVNLGDACWRVGEIDQSLDYFSRALALYKTRGDGYGIAAVHVAMKKMHAVRGNWRAMFETQAAGLAEVPEQPGYISVRGDLLGSWAVAASWAGRYSEAERQSRADLDLRRKLGSGTLFGNLRDLGYALGMQGRYAEAEICFVEACDRYRALFSTEDASTLSFWGAVALRQGDLAKARDCLERSWAVIKRDYRDRPYYEGLNWQARLHAVSANLPEAEAHYRQCLEYRWTNRNYFHCDALAGLIRIRHAQQALVDLLPLVAEAEALAQRYEYNDHLASLRLTQGHVAWAGHLPEWGQGFDASLKFYREALLYALRYNRFLLDEVLWGSGVCSPLRSIEAECQARGNEGRQMLAALRAWWQTGSNVIGAPRPDTISIVPEGVALLEAEQMARDREPGEGSSQLTLTQRLDSTQRPAA